MEEWKWVSGYEGRYMVSNEGCVISVPVDQIRGGHTYRKPGKTIAQQDNGSGYQTVCLYKNGKGKFTTVHRLVAIAFIDNPDKKPQVNHLDGDKSNNCVSNLEWVTAKENSQHASVVLHALDFNQTLSPDDVIEIRSDNRTYREIAAEYGLSSAAIQAIKSGKTYKRVGGTKRLRNRERQRKLSDSDVREIRTSNLLGKELAEKYGVAPSTISKIKTFQRYKETKNVD